MTERRGVGFVASDMDMERQGNLDLSTGATPEYCPWRILINELNKGTNRGGERERKEVLTREGLHWQSYALVCCSASAPSTETFSLAFNLRNLFMLLQTSYYLLRRSVSPGITRSFAPSVVSDHYRLQHQPTIILNLNKFHRYI